MTWMSTVRLGRYFLLFALAILTVSCAPANKSKLDSNEEPQTRPGPSAPNGPSPVDPEPTLPKLTDAQKIKVIDVLTGLARMGNALEQFYTPSKDAELDSVEQYILKTLQDYCQIKHDSSKSGNENVEEYSLAGDACSLKNSKTQRTSIEQGAGFAQLNQSTQDKYQLLSPELTQVVPLLSLQNSEIFMLRESIPRNNVLQRLLKQNDSKVIETQEYGKITATLALDLNLLNLFEFDADGNLQIGELLNVTGSGQIYRLVFSDFTAELKITFSRKDGRLAQEATLNGEKLGQGSTIPDKKPSSGSFLTYALSH